MKPFDAGKKRAVFQMCQNQLLVLILRIIKYFSIFSYCHMPVTVR